MMGFAKLASASGFVADNRASMAHDVQQGL
jgi:hypothetical protein